MRVTRIKSIVNIKRETRDTHLLTNVTGRSAARHRVKNHRRLKIIQKVLDQITATVAGPFAVAIVSGSVEVI
jgi:hypothetical protein